MSLTTTYRRTRRMRHSRMCLPAMRCSRKHCPRCTLPLPAFPPSPHHSLPPHFSRATLRCTRCVPSEPSTPPSLRPLCPPSALHQQVRSCIRPSAEDNHWSSMCPLQGQQLCGHLGKALKGTLHQRLHPSFMALLRVPRCQCDISLNISSLHLASSLLFHILPVTHSFSLFIAFFILFSIFFYYLLLFYYLQSDIL